MNVICEVQYLFSEEGVKGETVDIVVTVLPYTIYSELCLTPTPKECQIVTQQNLFRPFREFTKMGRWSVAQLLKLVFICSIFASQISILSCGMTTIWRYTVGPLQHTTLF
jgi:hypothetical protein